MPVYSATNKAIGSSVTIRWPKSLEQKLPEFRQQVKTGVDAFLPAIKEDQERKNWEFVLFLNKKGDLELRERVFRLFKSRKSKVVLPREEFKPGIGEFIGTYLPILRKRIETSGLFSSNHGNSSVRDWFKRLLHVNEF